MPRDEFRIFLSAVTSEFGKARDALASDLRSRDTVVKLQSDFRQEAESDTTLRKLYDYIRGCNAVVCMMGKRSGALPPPAAAEPFSHMLPSGISRASYTQWEFFFARHERRRLSLYVAANDYQPDKQVPDDAGNLDLQRAFLGHIIGTQGLDRTSFSNVDQLCRAVLKEDWPSKRALPASNIPILVPIHFMGREDALAAIEQALTRYRGRVAITALQGLRGVGKTTLAAAYAEFHRADYRVTWWIRAQSESSMRADLFALGVRLGWVAEEDKEEPALGAVRERLRHESDGMLLIYDNATDADALRPYLPPGGDAHVLITTNDHNFRSIAEPVEIRLWPKTVGADYLIARTGRAAERSDAEALSVGLSGLPLAHEQAAAYCERLDVSFAEYRRRFEATTARFLDDRRNAPIEYHDGMTVAKSFALAIEQAAKLHPAAEPLIVHAALLEPEPIPLFLFAEARRSFAKPFAAALADDGLDEAVAALRAFALVDRVKISDESHPEIETPAIRVHRLVRLVAQTRSSARSKQDYLKRLASAFATVFPDDAYSNTKSWPRCAMLIPHLVARQKLKMRDRKQIVACSELMDRAGLYLLGRASYPQAAPLLRKALAIRIKFLGVNNVETARSFNNLGALLEDRGVLARARACYERALASSETAVGPEHFETARSLNNLGALLRDLGELELARPLLERALTIREEILGPDHPNTATSLNSLALLLQRQGELAGAKSLFERALSIREKEKGPEHPYTARCLANLARLLQDQGKFAEARPLYERALSINEKSLGPEHPVTARILNGLANLSHAQGDLADARALHERAAAIREKVLGQDHPSTNRGRYNYARLLMTAGQPAQALALAETALAGLEKAYGRKHPWTQDCVSTCADALAALGRDRDAVAMRLRYDAKRDSS